MPSSLGPAEILVILVVALIVLGPTKLPQAGRQVGKALTEIRRWTQDVKSEMTQAFDAEMTRPAQATTPAHPASTPPEPAATASGPAAMAAPTGPGAQAPIGPTGPEAQPPAPEPEAQPPGQAATASAPSADAADATEGAAEPTTPADRA